MAAEVQVVSLTGPTPTVNVITSDRFCCADQVDPGLSYANQVPETVGATNPSFWKHEGLQITSGGSFSQLSNFRWGTPGNIRSVWGLGSGYLAVALKDSGVHGCPLANYARATGVVGEYGYGIKAADPDGHPYYNDESVALADADTYKSSNPLVFDNRTITEPGYTYFVVTQLIVAHDTVFGNKPILYNFFRWQEI